MTPSMLPTVVDSAPAELLLKWRECAINAHLKGLNMVQETYTVQQVADLLHVHAETVRRAIRSKELPAARFGDGRGQWVISRVELVQWWARKGGGKLFENEEPSE